MAIESYKYKSKITTAISFIAAFITYVGKDGLAQIMPAELASWIPIIVLIAGYIATQKTEDKRVDVAETLIHSKYNQSEDVDPTADYENEDYPVVGEDDAI